MKALVSRWPEIVPAGPRAPKSATPFRGQLGVAVGGVNADHDDDDDDDDEYSDDDDHDHDHDHDHDVNYDNDDENDDDSDNEVSVDKSRKTRPDTGYTAVQSRTVGQEP